MADPPADPRLLEAALRASQTLDLTRFVEACMEGLGKIAAADGVHAYLRAVTGKDLELAWSWTARPRGNRRPPAVIDGRAIKDAGEGKFRPRPDRLRPGGRPWPPPPGEDLLLFPIGRGRGAHGVFLLTAGAERGPFTGGEIDGARALLAAVEPALRNIAFVGALKETALRDDIADCYNRRHFETFLAEEIARAKRFGATLSLLFLDMDNLKEVNSAHGHSMGSRTLQEVAHRINASIRKIDKLFRFGGDEFCIVLPETDTRGACEAGLRIRQTIADAPLLVPEVGGVALTASLGVATYPDHGTTGETLVEAADRAMQAGGKNAVGTADSAPALPGPSVLSPKRLAREEFE